MRRKLSAAASSAISGAGGSSSVLTIPMDQPSDSNSGEGVFSTNSTPSAAATIAIPSPSAVVFLEQGNCNSNNGSTNVIIHTGTGSRANLMDENDRLKKENTQLCKELKQMKSMCTNIYSMMSNYNPGSGPVPGLGHGPGPPIQGQVGCGSSNSSQAESIINPLNLLTSQRLLATVVETQAVQAATIIPAALEDTILNSRLFGFQLGSKRARGQEGRDEDPMEQDDYLQLQQPGSRY